MAKKAFIFPGQGCQKEGMGKDLYEKLPLAKDILEKANDALGYRLTNVMFDADESVLMQTQYTQPAVFVYEVALALCQNEIKPDMVAGHSLGEFAALVVSGVLSFEDALNLVCHRARLGQEACEKVKTAMGAVIGLSDEYVARRIKDIWDETGEPIYFANYNGPGQVVISGSKKGIKTACKAFMQEGAKRAVPLLISGSFHTPYMNEASVEMETLINRTTFMPAEIPVYQCVDGKPHTDQEAIRSNLIMHLTHPVRWTDITMNMLSDGATDFYELGTDDTLQKIVSRMCPNQNVTTIWNCETYKNIKPYKIEDL